MIFPNLSLLKRPSLLTRMLIGKGAGLLIGIILFFTLLATWPSVDPLLPWGVLFWYVTVGAMIGLAGIYTRHPALGLPLPWWVRAPVIGAWMNFVLRFLSKIRCGACTSRFSAVSAHGARRRCWSLQGR